MRISDWSSDVCSSDLLDQLKLGMTHEQVHYLIGTPIAASAFRPNRWDYVGYYKSPRGEVTERIVSLYFADNVLARMDGIAKQGETKAKIGRASCRERVRVDLCGRRICKKKKYKIKSTQ